MSNWAGQFNVRHALATHFGQRDFDAALFTNNATMLEALVFAAQAFVVFNRAKDFGAEQTITLRLERAVVDGFRLFDFAKRPRTNLLRRCQPDGDRIKFFFRSYLLKQIQ